MNIRTWLSKHGLEEYADAFAENGVDAELLPELSNEDLKDLGILRLVDRKRLLHAIEKLPASDAITEPEKPPVGSSEGERRQVTALFADLAGFTDLSSKLDPEDLHDLLTRFYEIVDGMIEHYGGTVDKHLGDGVMALFGAPKAHDDDPMRAVRAAFDIHKEMLAFSAELKRDLSVHVGIASGEVIAGELGGDGNKQYTVLGDSVNLASRLDSLADPGETMIDEIVHRAVTSQVDCSALGEVKIKGLDEPVQVWRALGLLNVGSTIERGVFVGRRSELRQFEGILTSCIEDREGQVVLLRGEAGIGKTRLLEEFIKASQRTGFVLHKGLVLNFGVGKGQDAIATLVRSLLDVVDGSDNQRSVACDAAISTQWIAGNQHVFLRDLLDLPQPNEFRDMYNAMDNDVRNLGKQRVVADLISAITALKPAVLVVEDVHWADQFVLDQLATITATVCNTPAILVMTSRIEGDPLDNAWRSKTHNSPLMTIDLGPLRQNEVLELVGKFIDERQIAAQRCIERADGNPLFLEQLLRNAAEEETDNESVPASIQSLILARIDRLHTKDKEVLQAAAVLGQRFALDTLRYLIDDQDLDCANLIDHQLIRPEGNDYLFSHAMIQEGVYSSLLKKRRHTLHLKAANLFNDTDLVLKAEHLDRAEDPTAPIAYLEAATAEADDYHYEQSLRLLQRGLEIAHDIPDKFSLICKKGQTLHDLGLIDPSIEAYSEALDMSEDDHGRCRAWLGLAAGLRMADRYDEALEVLDKAEAVARDHDMPYERSTVHHIRGNLYFPMGRIDECAVEHEKSLKFAQQAHSPKAEANALSGMADASYVAGRMATALQYFGRCVDVANQNEYRGIAVINSVMVGFGHLYQNQLDEALEDALKAIAEANKVGHQRAEIVGESLAVMVLYEMADYTKARPHTDRAIEMARQIGSPRFESQALVYKGKLDHAEGQSDQAIKALEQSLEICKSIGFGFSGARIIGALANCLIDPKEKCDALDEGMRMLKAGSVGHNHFHFYPDAIEVSLGIGDWHGALRYASALEDFAKPEPLPWSNFFIARGRALAAWGQGQRNSDLTTEIKRLCDEATSAKLKGALPALEEALNTASSTSVIEQIVDV